MCGDHQQTRSRESWIMAHSEEKIVTNLIQDSYTFKWVYALPSPISYTIALWTKGSTEGARVLSKNLTIYEPLSVYSSLLNTFKCSPGEETPK